MILQLLLKWKSTWKSLQMPYLTFFIEEMQINMDWNHEEPGSSLAKWLAL